MNKTTSIVLAVAIVVVFLGIGAAVILGSSSNDDNSPVGEYTYKIVGINAYPSSSGYINLPSDGKQFVAANIEITITQNKTYTPFTPDFDVVCDDVSFKYKMYENDFTKIGKGEKGNIIVIYEIPASFSKLSIKWTDKDYDVENKTGDITSFEKKVAVEDSIKWDYKLVEDVTSFPRISGYGSETAGTGKHFIVIQVIEKNVSYEGSDYSPSMSHFKLKGSDNITYDYSFSSSSYSDDNSGLYDIKLGKGASKTYHIVFEIPSTTSLSSILFNQGSYNKWLAGQDDSLLN